MGYNYLIGWMIGAVLAVVTIGMHYELIRLASDVVFPLALRRLHNRRSIILMIITLMAGHITEIWMFAVAMAGIAHFPSVGYLSGNIEGNFNDFVYYSAVSYTSVGYGDIYPHGIMRPLSVSETLTGLLMIAWSASFTYLKMEQIWKHRKVP